MSAIEKGLCSLTLGGFKAFGAAQRIPVRPLTLIYGANSAGKSSIIHSLLLARHALETGNLDVHQTKLGGESLDLGGFSQYVHKRDESRSFEWGMELKHKSVDRLVEYLGGFSRTGLKFEIGLPAAKEAEPAPPGTPCIKSLDIHLDALLFMRLELRSDGLLYPVLLNFEHPVTKRTLLKLVDYAARRESPINLNVLDEGEPPEIAVNDERADVPTIAIEDLESSVRAHLFQVPFSTEKLFPKAEIPKGSEDEYAYVYPDYDPQALLESFEEKGVEWIARVFRFGVENLFKAISEACSNVLERLTYLGPLRCYPPRHVTGMQDHHPDWFSGGGHAWELIRRKPEVLNAVNDWLTAPDRLAKQYRLSVRTLAAIENLAPALQAQLEDALGRLLAAGKSSVSDEAETVTKNLLATKPAGVLSEIVLKDIQSGTEVSHRDIGQGISQVLPVLVNAFALRKSIIAIEQPELHLHPALQSELADVFIQSALSEAGNKLLIETHSEHLLLRVMRRMRETHNGTLPDGKLPLVPEDIAVLYVEPYGDRSIVREMPLNARGELIKDWPGGFFEEGLREVLT